MIGSSKVWLRCSFSLLAAATANAFVPPPGQVARFQPEMLARGKAWRAKGSLIRGQSKITTTLVWYGRSHYELRLAGVPRNFYVKDSPAVATQWTLRRKGAHCSLDAEGVVVSCPPPSFWAMLELSAEPNNTARALRDAGFISDSDTVFTESDSRKKPEGENRVRPAMGYNGRDPVALIEIRGPDFHNSVKGEEYPLLHFSQTFLSPIMARFMDQGDLMSIKALADLSTGKEQPRYSHVLAYRLDVLAGKNTLATFRRDVEAGVVNPKEWREPKTLVDVAALHRHLSHDGMEVLRALLLTH